MGAQISSILSLLSMVLLIGCADAPSPASPVTQSDSRSTASGSAEQVTDAATPDATVEPPVETAIKSAGAREEISFDDLNLQLQPNMAFRPWMLTERAQELDGKQVRIAGYMLPDTKLEGIDQFVLLRNTECKFGPGGQPDHLLAVTLRKGLTTSYRGRPIQIDGTLKIDPYQGPDGNTWYIYELNDTDNVVTIRR